MKRFVLAISLVLLLIAPLYGDTIVKLSFNNEEILVRMTDSPSSRDFVAMLPLTLTFEDYNNTEKISNLPEKLSTQGAPAGITPSAGDFTYYSPWGNLAIFYKDFRYSERLVPLGRIESGLEKLTGITSDFTVKIEKAD